MWKLFFCGVLLSTFIVYRYRPKHFVYLSDFVKYPCLPGSNRSNGLRPLDRCIRTVNVQLLADTVTSTECVALNFGTSTPICIHDPKIDIYMCQRPF